jgi:integrase
MADTRRVHLTQASLESLPAAAPGKRDSYHDTKQPALTLRVTENGKKTFRVRGRPRGRLAVEVLTIGPFPAIKIEEARAAAAEQVSKWARAESIVVARATAARERAASITLFEAVKQYVDDKRRGKDGKALKRRTRDDYLSMVEASREGSKRSAGPLSSLANKPLNAIKATDIQDVYRAAQAYGARQATYAMQVLRAVLRWHEVKVEDNPLDKGAGSRSGITLALPAGKPNPIPAERLGAWWRAAKEPSEEADYLRLLLLTGCRSGEVKGSERGELVFAAGLVVGDVDLVAKRLMLRDTKNRSDHAVLLSSQALEIVQRRVRGKTPAAPLFDLADVRAVLKRINAAAGVDVSPHDLRATFASVAEELVSVYVLKRMLNHAAAGDVTAGHYVAKSETQLRAGWQAVADFVDELAASKPQDAEQVAA